jgi:hypothetical protein
MVATRGSVRFNLSGSNPSAQTRTSTSEAQPHPSRAGVHGQWTPNGFVFSSPEELTNWHRDAYRQAVSHENWHKGQIVDADTARLIDADVAGPTPPTFRGPDGQLRYFGTQTAEGPDVAAIRAQHFRAASRSDFERTVTPGEAEAIAHMTANSTAAPAVNDNTPPAIDISQTFKPELAGTTLKDFEKKLPAAFTHKNHLILADFEPGRGAAVPSELLPPEWTPAPSEFGSRGGAEPAQGTDTGAEMGQKNRPNVQSGRQPGTDYSQPSTPPGAVAASAYGEDYKEYRGKLIDWAARVAVYPEQALEDWAKRQEDNPNNKDPENLAREIQKATDLSQSLAINAFNEQKFAIDGMDASAVEMDAIQKAVEERWLSKFSEANKAAIIKEWAKRGHIIQNGPIGLEAALGLFQNADTVSISAGGQVVQAKIPNPWGRPGGPDVKALNEMVDKVAKEKIEACEGFSGPKTLGGVGGPEYWFQDYSKRNVQLGGRYMDLSIQFNLNDRDTCQLHINTVDVLKSGLISKKEWSKIGDALTHAKGNAERDDIIKDVNDLIRGKAVSKSVAFLAIPKQAKDMSPDELRKAVQDFLDMISCANITAACESNSMINLDRQTAPDKFQIRK